MQVLLILSNFSFCHIVLKNLLMQMLHEMSTIGKGIINVLVSDSVGINNVSV